ncbi:MULTISPECIES: carbohydrate ABC transporter permease [Streptomyces]|jgi:alpha-glucoside transport system permease protein|uniref:Carbohydrate ABC transporter permease n=1 Tax=Streptomyces mirabilis TaxID=68239 RepID=A0ABU3UWG5_9ACTN|nr:MULTISPECIES: carbohydrate ABC transporter permease [Streptomyces]KAF5997960.1 carbohydrate ABC transporter permease [Streptomyces sp. WAC00263]MCX4425029.1 carbohydrate ABC transporter permease [Streptomyces mirabilis]MCX4607918.1 carbohydrate ABC transporter permease [Streptomyces mirabilis]MCX5348383.1 carbohydrate ABC transporter permease [Streptomyces mirabilis]MCZ1005324.1 carbohydrate ABC transporter permease [Streptomyces mirabilis]
MNALRRGLGNGLVQAFLVIVGLVWVTPLAGLFLSSMRSAQDTAEGGWWTVLTRPGQLSFDNYSALLGNAGMTRAFWNTVLISVPATVLVVVIAALAGYAFAWLEFPFRDTIFLVVVALLVVPVQIGLLPVAKLFGALGLFGTIPGVVLFHVSYGLPFAIFLLRNYFAEMPKEMLEAARMDGGSEWRIFTRLVLPVGRPALASLAIFQFLWVWNDMLVALLFADSSSQPLTVELQSQIRQFGSNIDVLAPGAFLSLIVPVMVFFAFQRHFVQGVMAGSVK